MERYSKCVVFIFILLMFLGIPSLRAFWTEDGVIICTETNDQEEPQITSDGAGGAIITWFDFRSLNYDIYAQRIDAGGNVQWTADGIAICTATSGQEHPQITSDCSGGAVITWHDSRGADWGIYAQRIDAGGNVQWSTDGVAICTATGSQIDPQITSDGAGGAVITWYDLRYGNGDIFAQRIDAGGNVQWPADGVAVCTTSAFQVSPQITSDDAGGAIITWGDQRNGLWDVYAQRIDAGGNVQWAVDGVAICTELGDQEHPQITSDGAGGAVISWDDTRSGVLCIYAQRIDADGDVQWTADGVAICISIGNQVYPQITSDGSGGAVIAWYNSSGGSDIRAQRVDADGNRQWTANGVTICTATSSQIDPQITSDGAGGAVITWYDQRSGNGDIYGQRVDADGNPQWTANGVAICAVTGDQEKPQITFDGSGGAVVTWYDNRSGDYDIYAQQINRDGKLGYLPPEIHSVRDVPGDEGGWVNIAWDASRYDPTGGEITQYTIWRALDTQAAITMLDRGAVLLNSAEQIVPETDESVVRLEFLSGQKHYWELIDSHDAYYFEGYSKIVPTAFDSSDATSDYHYFQVVAHTSDPMTFYVSDPDSGYSVDNLAPAQPQALTGEQAIAPDGLTLSWRSNTEPDLGHYAVYRGLNADFTPGSGNLIASPSDTTVFDADWRWDSDYYYKVSAKDVHGNESSHALLGPDDITGTHHSEIPKVTFLSQNVPNPFNPSTSIAFGLEAESNISLKIYDVSGRLVRVLVEGRREARRYEEVWDGRNGNGSPAATGVYFYRLTEGNRTLTKKMVLLK